MMTNKRNIQNLYLHIQFFLLGEMFGMCGEGGEGREQSCTFFYTRKK